MELSDDGFNEFIQWIDNKQILQALPDYGLQVPLRYFPVHLMIFAVHFMKFAVHFMS